MAPRRLPLRLGPPKEGLRGVPESGVGELAPLRLPLRLGPPKEGLRGVPESGVGELAPRRLPLRLGLRSSSLALGRVKGLGFKGVGVRRVEG